MPGFQTAVTLQPAIGVAGDFASHNPRANAIIGAGGFVAGPLGTYVGRFCWADYSRVDQEGSPAAVNNFGSGPVLGFVHREQIGALTSYLQSASMLIPAGFGLGNIFNAGDFLAVNDGDTPVTIGMKAYARFADGKVRFGATGTPGSSGSATGSIAAATNSVTGSIAGDIMTVTALLSGTVRMGTTLSGAGVVSGTKVVDQLSGTAGGVGTYRVSIQQTVASTTISGTYGIFTAASALTGDFVVGSVVTGTGISVPTTITEFISGTGGLGTYAVDVNTVVASTTISATDDVETRFYACSPGVVGDLIKMSTTPPV
jgi:hypothetical protein